MTETENKVQDTQKIGIIQKMVRLKQENTLTLIIHDFKNSHVLFIENFQQEKERNKMEYARNRYNNMTDETRQKRKEYS